MALLSGARLGPYEIVEPLGPRLAVFLETPFDDGAQTRWRRDGRELFYTTQLSGGKMMAVDVRSSGSTFEAGTPKELFDSPYVALPHSTGAAPFIFHPYAVSADGQRFLIPHSASSDAANLTMPIAVVVNWAAGLRK